MAISFIDNSTTFVDTATGTLVVSRPTTYSAGDMLIAFIGGKAYNTTITPPTGWTSIGSSTNGTTASGVGTGSTIIQAFYKIATASEGTSYSFTLSAFRTVLIGMIQVYRTDLTWITPTGVGAINSTSTGWTTIQSTATSDLNVGTFLPTAFIANINTTAIGTSPIFSSTLSVKTYSSFIGKPITAYTTTTGDDGGMYTGYATVTASSTTLPTSINILTTGPSADRGNAFIVTLNDFTGTRGNFFPFF
jgi:hypothetical protein